MVGLFAAGGLCLLVVCALGQNTDIGSFDSLSDQKEVVKEMFYHAYDGYLHHAFPKDELVFFCAVRSESLFQKRPISCTGGDTLGGYTLTLFDALDTLAVLQNKTEFARVVNWIVENVNFDIDKTVSGALFFHFFSSHFTFLNLQSLKRTSVSWVLLFLAM